MLWRMFGARRIKRARGTLPRPFFKPRLYPLYSPDLRQQPRRLQQFRRRGVFSLCDPLEGQPRRPHSRRLFLVHCRPRFQVSRPGSLGSLMCFVHLNSCTGLRRAPFGGRPYVWGRRILALTLPRNRPSKHSPGNSPGPCNL